MANTGIGGRRPLATDRVEPDETIVIAADSPRDAIVECLQHEELVIKTYDTADNVIARPADHPPTLILLWVEDPGSGLLGCVEPLIRHFGSAPLVMICPDIERWGIRTALTAGVAGIVIRKDLEFALCPCLQAVRAGQTCVPRAYARQIEPPALSTREKQILGLVVMGFTNGQIADQLFVAESTVKSHLSSAFGKLGVRSRNEAVHLILDPERGLGMGILALGGESMESIPPSSH